MNEYPQPCKYQRPECIEELTHLATMLERIDRELFGNGQPGRLNRIDDRLNTLEKWRYYIAGGCVLAGVLLREFAPLLAKL